MKYQKGFTLIELLIVIAVLAALAAVVVPAVGNFLIASKVTAANIEVQNIKTGALSYLADEGVLPIDSDALYGGGTDYMSNETQYGFYTFDVNSTQISNAIAKGDYGDIMEFIVEDQLWIKK